MLDKSKTYLIVGLGLLGGKYAQVLSQKGYNVTGITHSQSTLDYALQHDYIRAGKNADFEDLVREADCIIFGLYPTVLLDWVKQYGQLIRPGTMVTDVSGVKPVQAALPEGVEFIASHPMAGRETSGIAHSAEVNFAPANFIITPTEKNSQAGIDWCRGLAAELGYEYFCTTLSVSPHKDAERINRIGREMGEKYSVKWLPSDFKKREGYKRSIELSREFGLYRQDYCGCLYSKAGN